MLDWSEFYQQPLVSVGGLVASDWSVTLYMHRTYDRMYAI
jgi:hypothetical protein